MEQTTGKWKVIRLIYLYLASLIGLIVFIIGGVGLVGTGLKAILNVDSNYYMGDVKQICRDPYRFGYSESAVPAKPLPNSTTPEVKPVDTNSQEYKDCLKDEEERQKKQADNDRRRSIAESLAMIILGTPVWLYHWMVVQRDNKKLAE